MSPMYPLVDLNIATENHHVDQKKTRVSYGHFHRY